MVNLKQNERIDDLQLNGLKIIQNPNEFCFGIDAVLLSNFTVVKKEEVALDLGTGTGVIPILLSQKTEGKMFIGQEIQEDLFDMAKRSVLLNNLQNKVEIHLGDIKQLDKIYKLSTFDVITCNPPYIKTGSGIVSDTSKKAIARHEILCTLEDVICNSSKLLKPNGRFYMVHRTERLSQIISLLKLYKLEPKLMQFVYSFIDKPSHLVLIEAVRGGKEAVTVFPPKILYDRE